MGIILRPVGNKNDDIGNDAAASDCDEDDSDGGDDSVNDDDSDDCDVSNDVNDSDDGVDDDSDDVDDIGADVDDIGDDVKDVDDLDCVDAHVTRMWQVLELLWDLAHLPALSRHLVEQAQEEHHAILSDSYSVKEQVKLQYVQKCVDDIKKVSAACPASTGNPKTKLLTAFMRAFHQTGRDVGQDPKPQHAGPKKCCFLPCICNRDW